MRIRTAIAIALVSFLVPACSDPGSQGVSPGPAAQNPDPGTTPDAGESPGDKKRRSPGPGGYKKGEGVGRDRSRGNGDKSGGSDPDDDEAPSGEGATERGNASFPAAGEYLYEQAGFEEFCQAASCDRRDLPETQEVDARVESRGGGSTVVVTEARASEGRIVRTTTDYTRTLANITKVYARFSYEGFTFENTYEPQPPVESLRLPLTVDESWSGEWEARTSGDYEIEVQGRDRMRAGGRSVSAFRIETHTNFRGEFRGEADVTIWIDPETLAVVKSAGRMELSSAFGDFNTAFTITLRAGPGYG